MGIISQLSSALQRRDEIPNQELARKIIQNGDKKAVKELVENLTNKSSAIQSDCIKVLYEIAEVKPMLISGYVDELIALLSNKNNRLQWGAMTALHAITQEKPAEIYGALPQIIAVADAGSVITNDHCMGILIKLYKEKKYTDDAFSLLNERLKSSATNQLPMYAENFLPFIEDKHKAIFAKTLTERLPEIEKEAKRKRVDKVIKKVL